MIHVGVNVQPAEDLRAAMYPLFEAGDVDVIECTWEEDLDASWVGPLVDHYAADARLCAHLVSFPVCCEARDLAAHLTRAREAASRRRYRHVSAHFGVVEARELDDVAPLPVVPSRAMIERGAEALLRLRDATGVPVGLENLALAFSERDVRMQGALLDALLAPCDGFLLLDVHNLYCQAHNFEIAPEELLASYPLARVREIHVSGGRWDYPASDPRKRAFRRDTHDDAVPDEVFEILRAALEKCTHVDTVIVERIRGTLHEADAPRFHDDYRRVRALASSIRAPACDTPVALSPLVTLEGISTETLAIYERDLMRALLSGAAPHAVLTHLRSRCTDAALRDHVASFEPRAIEMAAAIQARWARARS